MARVQPAITVMKLCKSFGRVKALDELGLEVEPGIFGLIGPNGAGKTTLLRILLGLIQPDSGGATVLGHDVRRGSLEVRQKTGVLHERPAYPGNMRVGQYLRRVAGLYENWRNPDDLLELVGLSDASEKRVSHLSAGMRQRLGIAQAMVGRPELLFLDEPTSNLDVPGRWDVLQMILRIHNETGATFFICSHILSELERVCTHVAFLVRGRLIDSGALPDILKKHTANLYRVAVSDVRILLETVRQLPGVVSAEVSGTTTVDVLTSKESAEDVRKQIMQTVERLNLQLYGFDKASTLEQAFWEATRDEKHN